MSVIQTASFEITKTVSKILKEFKMDKTHTQIIGGGGGASVLVPFVAKQLGISYKKAEHADVISSIGVASSMIQEEIEHTITNPTPEQISELHKKIHQAMIDKGAIPESITIDSEYISEKSLLRISATGNVEMDSADNAKNVFIPILSLFAKSSSISVNGLILNIFILSLFSLIFSSFK